MHTIGRTLKAAGWLVLLVPISAASQPRSAHKLPLVLRAVAVPRKDLLYQVSGSRNFTSYAEVACVLRNVSRAPIKIETCTADWYMNWSIDGWPVRPISFAFSANMPITLVLAPGETYAKTLPITFDEAKVGQRVTFRVRFITNPDLHFVRRPKRTGSVSYTVLSVPISMRVPAHTVHKIGAV